MYRLLPLLLILFSVTCCKAQFTTPYNFKFKNYSTSEGLADNLIVKTVKDKHGFLWVATHNGICRFDGLVFKNYTHQPGDSTSLRSIWVSDLIIDHQQVLWASTEWGLCWYDEDKDQFRYVNKTEEMQLVFKMPLAIDDTNNVWIASEDGLRKVNSITKKYTGTALTRIHDPQFIIADRKNNLVIGTRGKGIYQYSITANSYRRLYFPELPNDIHYMDAMQDEDGIWIATSEGLLLLHSDGSHQLYNKGLAKLTGKTITQLMCVNKFQAAFSDGKLICGTYDKKLFLFDKQLRSFTYQWQSNSDNPGGFEPSIVCSIQEDRQILWIGTDRGLVQLNLENQQQQSFFIKNLVTGNEKALVKKVVCDAVKTSNLIWVISWQPCNGIMLYDLDNKKVVKEWNSTASFKPKKYTDIVRSAFGNVIMACRDSAVDFFNAERGLIKTTSFIGKALCIKEDSKANLWIGLEDGICFIDIKTNTVQKFTSAFKGNDLEANAFGGLFRVHDIDISPKGMLWLAVKYGLFSFDPVTKIFYPHRQFANARFSVLDHCNSIGITNEDSIWEGNMAGLSCYIPSQNRFVNYNAGDGLKSTYIYSLVRDEHDNLWARGNADIFCFNINTKKITGSKLNQQYDVSCYQQRLSIASDQVMLGHEGGFSIFNSPGFIKPASELPSVFINSCKVNNSDVFFNRHSNTSFPLQLKYFENQLFFDLNAVEYNHPEEIEYRYMLEGMEKNWTSAGTKRSITYNYLSPGKYRFAAFVTNKRNNTKSDPVYFSFVIHPAWWQHWWLWPMTGLIFITSVIVIARKRITHIKKKEEQKTALNKMMAELENQLLRSQMNPHFIFNSLNSIQKYIWENKEEEAAEYLASFAKLMRAILENSRKEYVLLQEEMKVMKLYVELEHRRSNGGFDYNLKAAESLLQQQALIPPLIMQPFIENAIWHGLNKKEGKGNLLVQVFEKDNQLICVIDDDGAGIQLTEATESKENKSLGIEITRQRIQKLMESTGANASIVVLDKKQENMGEGTLVTITLPLKMDRHA